MGRWWRKLQRNKELVLTILNVSPTRRDAQEYLRRYTGRLSASQRDAAYRSMLQADMSSHRPSATTLRTKPSLVHRIAVMRYPRLSAMSEATIEGLARTVRKVTHLGLHCVIVPAHEPGQGIAEIVAQANEIAAGLESAAVQARPLVDGSLQQDPAGQVYLDHTRYILAPSLRSQVVVAPPLAVTDGGRRVVVGENAALLAIVRRIVEMESFLSEAEVDFVVEKVVLLDPIGGLPSVKREQSPHLFINLLQEHDSLLRELDSSAHIANLELARQCLELLPLSSAAIITTPQAAASDARPTKANSLIGNLITNRPLLSPSLPERQQVVRAPETTIIRLGRHVYSMHGYAELAAGGDQGLERLFDLVDNSFGRRLDRTAYRRRLQDSLLFCIIVGDYEGCAIVTREGGTDDPIPYLDKFAVRQESQGSTGVADVLFNSMMEECEGNLLWRSRATNPVNKWYFDRSAGSYCVPGTQWRMFWTVPDASPVRIQQYFDVCAHVNSCWQ